MSFPPDLQALIPAVIVARTEFGAGNINYVKIEFNGNTIDAVSLKLPPQAELQLAPTSLFPDGAPCAIMHWGDGGQPTLLALEWDQTLPLPERLSAALRKFIVSPGPYRAVWGPSASSACTTDSEVGRRSGWTRFLSGGDVTDLRSSAALQARVETGLAKILRKSTIAIVGVGSGGSYLTEQFARSGVGRLIVIDDDVVEPSNLSRTPFRLEHIGKPKVDAIIEIVSQANPNAKVDGIQKKFRNVGSEKIKRIIGDSDLVIGATDEPSTQILLSHCAYHLRKPAIFAAMYRGAKGGEVVVTVPEETPCLKCMVGPQRSIADEADMMGDVDYGTSRLKGEIALGCDIHHVSSAVLKIAMSLLATLKSSERIPLADFALQALSKQFHYLTMGMEPDYWFFPKVFGGVGGQFAYQSVWLTGEFQQGCRICGEQREDPLEHLTPTISHKSFRENFGSE